MNTHIRARRPEDLPGCAAALRKVHDHDAYPLNWPADPQAWLTPCAAAWVAEPSPGTIAAHAAVQPNAELTRLFVIPEARRHALARALIAEARAWAAARHQNLTLNVVATHRSAAITFYESTGWRHTRTTLADWPAPDGTPVHLRHYQLD